GGGFVCYFGAVILKNKLGYDDSLDAFGVHGLGGTFGALATGLFATKAINAAGNDGLFFGNAYQLVVQLITVVATWVFAFVATMILLKLIDATMGLRVTEEDEFTGLDMSEHGESGYNLQ
ncbi:MAG TPA: ammonia channel protein, partial [Nitrospiria bacterium]|nr:ammonia channel protein [Nitrospiria bacterium]